VTADATSLAIERRKVRKTFRRKAVLAELGLPFASFWEDAESVIRERIAACRRNGDENGAAELSAAKAFLKRNLRRHCACGEVICGVSIQCRACMGREVARRQKGKANLNKRKSYKRETVAIVEWIRKQTAPFYLSQLIYWTREHQPVETDSEIKSRVRGVIRTMKRRGEIKGGGVKNWQRFERCEKNSMQ
jgi:hypothetical protein